MGITISTVLTAYDVGPELQRTLFALRHQCAATLEVVVVTRAPHEFDDIGDGVRIVRCECEGPLCRNAGIRVAEGDVVAFLPAGAVPTPRWAHDLAAPYADPTVAAVGGAERSASRQWLSGRQLAMSRLDGGHWLVDAPFELYCDSGSDPFLVLEELNFSVRRSVLHEIGGIREFGNDAGAAGVSRRLIDGSYGVRVVPCATVCDLRDSERCEYSALEVPSQLCSLGDATFDTEVGDFVAFATNGGAENAPLCVIDAFAREAGEATTDVADGTRLLEPGSERLEVSPMYGRDGSTAWLHRVPTLRSLLGELSSPPLGAAIGVEAGLLRELLRINVQFGGHEIQDRRGSTGWPFAELIRADRATRERLVAQLIEDAEQCSAATAAGLATDLLDDGTYPVSLPLLVRDSISQPDGSFVATVFEVLLRRTPTAAEYSFFSEAVARPGGRTRMVRNVASCAESAQGIGSDWWLAFLDDEVEATRCTRLGMALAAPVDVFVREMYSAILFRSPDAPGFAHFMQQAERRSGRVALIAAFARSREAQLAGVDAVRVLDGLGWRRSLGPRVVLGARRQLGRFRRRVRRSGVSST